MSGATVRPGRMSEERQAWRVTSLSAAVPPARVDEGPPWQGVRVGLASSERGDPGVAYAALFPGGEVPRSYMRIL